MLGAALIDRARKECQTVGVDRCPLRLAVRLCNVASGNCFSKGVPRCLIARHSGPFKVVDCHNSYERISLLIAHTRAVVGDQGHQCSPNPNPHPKAPLGLSHKT